MTESSNELNIYQLKIHLLGISPMIWRRIQIRGDINIAELHYTIQLVMGWENERLHCFKIYGKDYGIGRVGGTQFSDNPMEVYFENFKPRVGWKFKYGVDLTKGGKSNRNDFYYVI